MDYNEEELKNVLKKMKNDGNKEEIEKLEESLKDQRNEKCKVCGKECFESELVDGICSDCLDEYKNDPVGFKCKENKIAKMIKILVGIFLCTAIIISFVILFEENGWIYSIMIMIITLISCLSIRAFAEIIQLLEDIKNK